MFRINNLDAGYAPQSSTVKSLSLSVAKGEVLCLLGRNGAGKTSTLKAIMGLMPSAPGNSNLMATISPISHPMKFPGQV